jgi:predicted DNA-binding protein
MPFITKAEPKKETKTASIQLDLETRNDLDLYVEFVDKPQGVVVREILQKVFQMDEEFAEYKVETMPETQSA